MLQGTRRKMDFKICTKLSTLWTSLFKYSKEEKKMQPNSLSWMEIQQIKEEMLQDVEPKEKDPE
jgi:hypothetical protein